MSDWSVTLENSEHLVEVEVYGKWRNGYWESTGRWLKGGYAEYLHATIRVQAPGAHVAQQLAREYVRNTVETVLGWRPERIKVGDTK